MFIPKCVPHTWENAGDDPARFLILFTPAASGMELFFERYSREPEAVAYRLAITLGRSDTRRTVSRQNLEICQRAWEAFDAGMARGDPGAFFDSEALAPDAEWIPPVQDSPGMRSVYRGREEFVEFIRTWTEEFEGWSVQLERLIDASDDKVVGLFHHRAKGKRSGVPVELHMALVYELEEGRVIRIWNFLDPAEAFAAVGLAEDPKLARGTSPFS